MDCGMRRRFITLLLSSYVVYLKTLFICFPTEVLHRVILERSQPIVEVASAGKGIGRTNQSYGKNCFQTVKQHLSNAIYYITGCVGSQVAETLCLLSTGLVVVASVPASSRKSCQQNPLSQRMWETYPSTLFKET